MKPFRLDETTYKELLDFINNQHFVERPGGSKDVQFLTDDEWLKDSAVTEYIHKRKGLWEIHLVFAHHKYPMTLIKRLISSHSCKNKAKIFACYMKRLAAKDQRGTLTVSLNDFGFCMS